jgi:hypothetical protein
LLHWVENCETKKLAHGLVTGFLAIPKKKKQSKAKGATEYSKIFPKDVFIIQNNFINDF